ncbi:MAG: hypothetical protein AVDCRST_MAG85-1466 [uncultured Solirubrobacteraceae bacterium]|uniref:Uncharacterized protein n=1 Tax=uncultured Solirubrobacteraceae bacterium TaxID=1162706 RepID=A0A6J4SH99_9ACTN|nr:MAG: hypothetical protein AVDCRST_MAG85-1466 [uncultured Solirubrobacteraceae bacterium]
MRDAADGLDVHRVAERRVRAERTLVRAARRDRDVAVAEPHGRLERAVGVRVGGDVDALDRHEAGADHGARLDLPDVRVEAVVLLVPGARLRDERRVGLRDLAEPVAHPLLRLLAPADAQPRSVPVAGEQVIEPAGVARPLLGVLVGQERVEVLHAAERVLDAERDEEERLGGAPERRPRGEHAADLLRVLLAVLAHEQPAVGVAVEDDLVEPLVLGEVGVEDLADERVQPADALARRLAPVPREAPAAVAGGDLVDPVLLGLVDVLAERARDEALGVVGVGRRAGAGAVEVRLAVGREAHRLELVVVVQRTGRPDVGALAADARAGEAGDVEDRQALGLHVPQQAAGRAHRVLAAHVDGAVDPAILRILGPGVRPGIGHAPLDDAVPLAEARTRRGPPVQRAVAARARAKVAADHAVAEDRVGRAVEVQAERRAAGLGVQDALAVGRDVEVDGRRRGSAGHERRGRAARRVDLDQLQALVLRAVQAHEPRLALRVAAPAQRPVLGSDLVRQLARAAAGQRDEPDVPAALAVLRVVAARVHHADERERPAVRGPHGRVVEVAVARIHLVVRHVHHGRRRRGDLGRGLRPQVPDEDRGVRRARGVAGVRNLRGEGDAGAVRRPGGRGRDALGRRDGAVLLVEVERVADRDRGACRGVRAVRRPDPQPELAAVALEVRDLPGRPRPGGLCGGRGDDDGEHGEEQETGEEHEEDPALAHPRWHRGVP